jgi:hypothetical protein
LTAWATSPATVPPKDIARLADTAFHHGGCGFGAALDCTLVKEPQLAPFSAMVETVFLIPL